MHVVAVPVHQESVRRQFSKSFVYQVMTEQGCACGFDYDPDWEGEPSIIEENRISRVLLAQLSAYLTVALNTAGPVELYAGYCDELELPPTYRGAITPDQLMLSRLNQQDRKFFVVSK